MIDIVFVAEIFGACSVLVGAILTVYKFYANTKSQNDIQNKKIKQIQSEQTLICYALSACLDGLEQLGANHSVPLAKEMLQKHLNKAAHDDFEKGD